LLALELVYEGANGGDLDLIGNATDLSEARALIADKLYADRADQMLVCTAWIGAFVAFLVGDLVTIATLHDTVYSATEWVSVGGLTCAFIVSALAARSYFVSARETMRKLLGIQRVLARWRSR
jgi:hypothetical protein